MPIFLDVHKVPFSEENLKELSESPVDEFGVSHVNLFYNTEIDMCFCLLKAPDKSAVENHHDKAGVKCEWITEVKMAKQ
ncbi:MAG TPA: nickel-binding protein [Candidatus Nitrosocosmicus sp.]